jgi:23S rRNA-intervening sequence protein
VAIDQGYISQEEFDELYNLLEEVSKMIFALARHLVK